MRFQINFCKWYESFSLDAFRYLWKKIKKNFIEKVNRDYRYFVIKKK